MEKISFSLKLFFDHFYGQSFIKTVRGPLIRQLESVVCLDNNVVASGIVCPGFVIYRGSYMSAHVLLNLLNELGKRDKMRGLPSILSLSQRV